MTNRSAPTPPASLASDAAEIRERAERQLMDRMQTRLADTSGADVERLVHELGVHQIELEIQNEELRRTQAELETSRDRYRALYEQAPVAYVTTDLKGVVLEANQMARALLGLHPSTIHSRWLRDRFAPGYGDAFVRMCHQVIADGTAPPVELRLKSERDEKRWVAVSATLGPGRDGAREFLVTLIDQSQRIELQETRAGLAAIVASSEDAIIGRSLDGVVTSWNSAAERLFGVTAADAVGKGLDNVLPPERIGDDREMIRTVSGGGKVSPFEAEWRHHAGHAIPVVVSVSPTHDETGRVAGLALIARDISERRRSERALRVRLRQLDLLAQAAQALIFAEPEATPLQRDLFDRVRLAVGGEIFLHYNLVARDSETLDLVSYAGLSDAAAAAMQRQPRERSLCGLAAARRAPLIIEHLQESPLEEAEQLKREGVACYAGFPLLVRGEVHGVVAFAFTTRGAFREGDLQVMQTVCDQVAAMLERTRLLADLSAREQALKLADRRKDDFIATLAHELRNPLAPIRNAVGILERASLPDPQLAWCRDVIERQVRQMTRLLEDLLDVSRVTRNRIELRRERIELRTVLDSAIEAVRPLIDAQRHRLTLDVPHDPILLYGDPARLTQVIANLLNNAAKYTDAGGSVHVRVQREGDEVTVAVIDNGIGMDPLQCNQVFDMFAQLAPALERSRGGLGIGLSLSRGLVEMHGGRIEARSTGLGTGSEFVVWLPVLHQTRDAQQEPGEQVARPGLAGRRVLVVDDNADAAKTLGTMLVLHGVETRVAFGGKEGLQVAEQWRPDAAVIDIGMPHFNGYEMCRRLRQHTWGESMLLIACTGWGQADDRARARAAGFDLHLVKPIEPDAVLRAIAEGRAVGHAP